MWYVTKLAFLILDNGLFNNADGIVIFKDMRLNYPTHISQETLNGWTEFKKNKPETKMALEKNINQ